MSQLYDMLQDIVNLSDEDKLRLFKESYLELLPVFKEVDPQTQGLSFISEIIGTAAAADGQLDSSEIRIMRIVTDASGLHLTDAQLTSLILDSGTEHVREQLVRLSEVLDPELRARLVMLTAVVCSLDDRINEKEIDLIASLMDD